MNIFNMLTTSSSQYYHPDYVSPLPGSDSNDRKNNPLVLLAKTCSSIGKDSSPNKGTKSTSDHKESSLKIDMNAVVNGDMHRKPNDLKLDISPIKRDINSSSDNDECSTNSREVSTESKARKAECATSPAPKILSPVGDVKSEPTSPISVHSDSRAPKTSTPNSSRSPISKANNDASPIHQFQTSKVASVPPIVPGLPVGAGLCYPSYHDPRYTMLAANPSLYPSLGLSALSGVGSASLLSKHGLSSSPLGSAHVLSAAHAQPRSVPGIPPIVPICRDPNCTGCQASQQATHSSSNCASPGCAQCAHERILSSLSRGMNGLTGATPGIHPLHSAYSLPGLAGMTPGATGLHSLYPYAAPSAKSGQSGCVCNWTSGTDYCGKRFSTPEELYQHLRTHTNESAYALQAQALGLPLGLGMYPSHEAASADSLAKSFHRSSSPSALSASRFHPYKSHLASVPPSAYTLGQLPTPLGLHHPAHLYGSKLGTIM